MEVSLNYYFDTISLLVGDFYGIDIKGLVDDIGYFINNIELIILYDYRDFLYEKVVGKLWMYITYDLAFPFEN